MKDLLKYTYLFDIKGIENGIERLWTRYQEILNNKSSNWNDINEARAILYFIGYLYPEKIALESLEKRVKYIEPCINLDKFLTIVDSKLKNNFTKSVSFNKLKDFYLIIKKIKNRVKNNSYLDEDRFNEIFNKLKPKNYL